MEIVESITKVFDFVPKIIGWARDFIVKITETLNLPTDSSMLIFMAIGFALSYFWIKQFITYSIWTKVSTLLNWVLLAILIYILFAYV